MMKPGEFKVARKRHLEAQARSDALKKLKEGYPTTVKALREGKTYLFDARPLEEGEPFDGQTVLCVFGQKLRVMTFSEKNGCRVIDNHHIAHIPLQQIYGIVHNG